MTITINTNIASLNAQRRLSQTTADIRKSFERLSSGLRIVRPSDDPAGLAIADSLAADRRLATIAIRNANDGVSTISIADGALEEIGNLLVRMAELSEEGAQGTLSTEQRSALNEEFVANGSEIERLARITSFNGLKLLSGTQSISFQIGIDATADSQVTLSGVEGTLSSLGLANAGSSTLRYSLVAAGTGSQAASLSALAAVRGAVGSVARFRGSLGASESRLSSAVRYLQVARENYASAESQIRDVDVAEEVSRLVRLSILQQAGASILAQANQQPAFALALLGA